MRQQRQIINDQSKDAVSNGICFDALSLHVLPSYFCIVALKLRESRSFGELRMAWMRGNLNGAASMELVLVTQMQQCHT